MDASRLQRPLLLAAAGLLAIHTLLALVVAPDAAGFAAPLTQRIFYFHVPTLIAGYVAFGLTLVGSVAFLSERSLRWDRIAAASAEVGVVLTTIGLFTGIVWSRVEFFSVSSTGGANFAFVLLADAKFVATAALWLVFLGYLALRSNVDEPSRRGRLSAVFGVLGFLGVPTSYVASRFSPHPDFLQQGSGLSPGLGAFLGFGIVAFLVVYAALFVARLSVGEGVDALAEREAATGGQAGPKEAGP